MSSRFILPVDMCAELSFEVIGRKVGTQDTFLGRVREAGLFVFRERARIEDRGTVGESFNPPWKLPSLPRKLAQLPQKQAEASVESESTSMDAVEVPLSHS